MSDEELFEENKKLKEKIELLEKALYRKHTNNRDAYIQIKDLIAQKIEKEVPQDVVGNRRSNSARRQAQRQCMNDLKWDLRVRNVADFTEEHIEQAKKYLETYKVSEKYKNINKGG